jgi:hypothetical protein
MKQPVIDRSMRCACAGSVREILEGLAVVRAPGARWIKLQGPSAAAAVLLRSTARKYSKRSPLTVLFRSQVQIIRRSQLCFTTQVMGPVLRP